MVEDKTGAVAEVVDIQTVDTENADYAEVVKLFDAYSLWALPIIMIEGDVVSWGTPRLDRIDEAIESVINPPPGEPPLKA